MNERQIRRRLTKQGYRLVTTTSNPWKQYAIVDENNCIVSSEHMELGDVEDWLNQDTVKIAMDE